MSQPPRRVSKPTPARGKPTATSPATQATYPDLAGENVIVTGGANGIGKALVRSFTAQGSRVWFCDCDAAAGARLAAQLGARFSVLDLGREREITAWVAEIERECRRVRVVVNNAARDPRIELERTATDDWDRLLALNLRAYFLVCRETARLMPAGGSIINLGSITFAIGAAPMTAYVASKGGVVGLSRALARELGRRGIRVNTLSPGWVMTERQLKMYVTPEVKRRLDDAQCVPALIQPQEIANVALFLASSQSSAITGQNIMADRGWAHL